MFILKLQRTKINSIFGWICCDNWNDEANVQWISISNQISLNFFKMKIQEKRKFGAFFFSFKNSSHLVLFKTTKRIYRIETSNDPLRFRIHSNRKSSTITVNSMYRCDEWGKHWKINAYISAMTFDDDIKWMPCD